MKQSVLPNTDLDDLRAFTQVNWIDISRAIFGIVLREPLAAAPCECLLSANEPMPTMGWLDLQGPARNEFARAPGAPGS